MPQHVNDQLDPDGPPPPAGPAAGTDPEGAPQAPFTLRSSRRDGAPADLTGDDDDRRFAERLQLLSPANRL
jgi:hypothetical protein